MQHSIRVNVAAVAPPPHPTPAPRAACLTELHAQFAPPVGLGHRENYALLLMGLR